MAGLSLDVGLKKRYRQESQEQNESFHDISVTVHGAFTFSYGHRPPQRWANESH